MSLDENLLQSVLFIFTLSSGILFMLGMTAFTISMRKYRG